MKIRLFEAEGFKRTDGQTQADGWRDRHEEGNRRFLQFYESALKKNSVDFVQGNYLAMLWELHKIHKHISMTECRLFSENPGGLYSSNWTLNVP
jgi:hypothetical protein